MKKLIALLLVAAMAFTFAACATPKSDDTTDTTAGDTTANDTTAGDTTANDTTANDTTANDTTANDTTADDTAANDTPVNGGTHKYENPETVAQKLSYAFEEAYDANNAITAQEMADTLLANEVITFGPASMPVEEGYLNGFDNEVKGFAEAVQFSPMIGSIPFMGFIFVLEEGADVPAFISSIEADANLLWNVCTEAEEMVTTYRDNMVFFCMSPLAF